MVSNLKAGLFTIGESWLTVNDCAILNKLTLSGYITLGHYPHLTGRELEQHCF